MEEIVVIKDLLIGYQKSALRKVVAGPVNLSLSAGEFICMIGQNGSGKTTLLKTLAGVQRPLKGSVEIRGKNISHYRPSQLSKILSVVLTDRVAVSNLDVYALVGLGRYPYTNWLGGLTDKDKKIIDWALKSTDTKKFINRQLGELSDGELQKVMVARALAQDTDIILLDEPTAHLDLPNRIEIFLLLKKLALETGKVILVSTHELDLALQSADKIWLIDTQKTENQEDFGEYGNHIFSGVPEDMVISGVFQKAFEKHGMTFDKMTGRFKINTGYNYRVNLSGNKTLFSWTERALERVGFKVDNSKSSSIQIEIDEENRKWFLKVGDKNFIASSIEELIYKIKQSSNYELVLQK
ncbi:MAG TPA: ABC transporter ATP-binding protein [Cytophagales bacterium]|nr:ABC transporter ATP-binding protein [Cytophagales bacterium]